MSPSWLCTVDQLVVVQLDWINQWFDCGHLASIRFLSTASDVVLSHSIGSDWNE